MSFQTETRHIAAKAHTCDYCGQRIITGSLYAKTAGKFDGEFYTARGHADCKAMWDEVHPLWADDTGRMDFDLRKACDDFDALLLWRGSYPHVICRIELGEQNADLRWAAQVMSTTSLRLDPSQYLHGDAA
jgi:hypothetical protein